jgi:hypothetical protein
MKLTYSNFYLSKGIIHVGFLLEADHLSFIMLGAISVLMGYQSILIQFLYTSIELPLLPNFGIGWKGGA